MKVIHYVALVLVVVGALNWGLVGLFRFDLVATLFGAGSPMSRVVYVLVGLAGVCIVATSVAMSSLAVRHRPAPVVH